MKFILYLMMIAPFVGGFGVVAKAEETVAAEAPVVVELFTSQGCNSCPPADALLGELAQRSGLIALAFHVDYWNYIGWKDPFSSAEATQRQRNYAEALRLNSVYTPQMVIDGRFDVVGSDRTKVDRAIAASKQYGKVPVTIAIDPTGRGVVTIPAADITQPATVWLALYDRRHVTPVKRGENAGATLIDYNVVREFRRIGDWDGRKLDLALDIEASTLGDRGVAILVQAGLAGPLLAATVLPTAE